VHQPSHRQQLKVALVECATAVAGGVNRHGICHCTSLHTVNCQVDGCKETARLQAQQQPQWCRAQRGLVGALCTGGISSS
jgi:hypothetical protein